MARKYKTESKVGRELYDIILQALLSEARTQAEKLDAEVLAETLASQLAREIAIKLKDKPTPPKEL